MKRLFTILLGVGSLCVVMHSSAAADLKTFVSVRAGEALPEFTQRGGIKTSGKAGAYMGASVGIQPSDLLRWDVLEFSYFSAYQSTPLQGMAGGFGYSNLGFGSGMRWGYFGQNWKLHPYVSFGVAANRSIYEEQDGRKSRWYFQWNAGLGLEYEIMSNLSLGARYRYSRTDFKRFDLKEGVHSIVVEAVLFVFQ